MSDIKFSANVMPKAASVELKPKKAGNISYADPEDFLSSGTYLRVEKDAMAAWLYLTPPEEGQYYSKSDLLRFLQNRGINSGLHSSNLSAIIKKRVFNREILVARGRETVNGIDGYFEYLFQTERSAPAIREDGTVDYTNMSALPNVHEGDKIAIYHPAVQGADGYTVYGAGVKARPGKELPPLRGKGILKENNEYFAQTDGKIEAKGGKIDIQKVHEIRGDVTLIIGKVEFFGDVIVYGNVESGVIINAGRNIEVHGTTGNATLYAGGDVILRRGIQGGGKISAKGSVYADFIENTMVEAGGIIQSNTILNAQVYAEDRVITTGKKGCIIGGYAHGRMGIKAVTVGSDAEARTILHCGYGPEDYETLLDLMHQEEDLKEKLEELTEGMTKALYGDYKRGPSMEKNLSEWKQMKAVYLDQLESVSMERERLEETVETSKGAHIKVEGYVHRNVIIGINAEQMVVNSETRSMRYSADRGVIEASVL